MRRGAAGAGAAGGLGYAFGAFLGAELVPGVDLVLRETKLEDYIKDADVVVTDTWASMGQEAEHDKRKKIFAPYQVNKALLKKADRRAIVMHCLPAYRGEEITDEVFEANADVIFDEAENRLHAQKAIMTLLMG